MLLDSGLAVFYIKTQNPADGSMPGYTETASPALWFRDMKVGITRFYAAKRENVQVDRLIRIWRRDSVKANDRCIIGALSYRIIQVQHTEDEDGLPVTDVSLTQEV